MRLLQEQNSNGNLLKNRYTKTYFEKRATQYHTDNFLKENNRDVEIWQKYNYHRMSDHFEKAQNKLRKKFDANNLDDEMGTVFNTFAKKVLTDKPKETSQCNQTKNVIGLREYKKIIKFIHGVFFQHKSMKKLAFKLNINYSKALQYKKKFLNGDLKKEIWNGLPKKGRKNVIP